MSKELRSDWITLIQTFAESETVLNMIDTVHIGPYLTRKHLNDQEVVAFHLGTLECVTLETDGVMVGETLDMADGKFVILRTCNTNVSASIIYLTILCPLTSSIIHSGQKDLNRKTKWLIDLALIFQPYRGQWYTIILSLYIFNYPAYCIWL